METVERMAVRIRECFDSGRMDPDRLAGLYQRYNELEKVGEFVSAGLRAFPRFCCGLASVYLREKIGCGRIVYGRYHTDRHSFLMIDGKMIVDITADQYGGPKVYVGPLRSPWSLDPAALCPPVFVVALYQTI